MSKCVSEMRRGSMEMNLGSIERADEIAPAWKYQSNSAFYDELVAADGGIRPHWNALVDSLSTIGSDGLLGRWQEGRRLLHDNGVTYNVYGDPAATDRPWPLDPVPLSSTIANGAELKPPCSSARRC